MSEWSISNGDPMVYWTIKILVYIALIMLGYNISKTKDTDKRNKFFIAVVVIYSLFIGLRWLRGPDYFHYYSDIMGNWITEDPEPLYEFLVVVLGKILPFWGVFIFYAAIYIGAAVLIIKKDYKTAVWSIPAFCLINEWALESMIRQDIGVAMVMFAYFFSLEDKKKYMFLCLACVPFIHTSGLFAVAFFILFYYIDVFSKIKKPWILIVVYLAIYYLWDTNLLGKYATYIQMLDFGDLKYQGYIDNSERWFTDEGSISGLAGKTIVTSFLYDYSTLFTNLSLIYYGFFLYKKEQNYFILFAFFYFGLIIRQLGGDIELFRRFANWLNYMTPFLIGLILTKLSLKPKERAILYALFFVNYGYYGFIRSIGSPGYTGCAFIWDS